MIWGYNPLTSLIGVYMVSLRVGGGLTMDRVPVIDLDEVSDDVVLQKVLRSILLGHDTFLLKNYANREKLDLELSQLSPIDVSQGFDSNFTGALQLEDDVVLEQYIATTDAAFKFAREAKDPMLRKVSSRLLKVLMYFSQLCLRSLDINGVTLDDAHHSTKLVRYYHPTEVEKAVLPDGSDLEFEYEASEFNTVRTPGILSVIPVARNVRVKPSTMSNDENVWITIDEPDCLLLHTGELLAKESRHMHSTSPLQINMKKNVVQLTLLPALGYKSPDANTTLAQDFLEEQILEFKKVSQVYYPREFSILQLKEKISFVKALFNVAETVVSLHQMSRASNRDPLLHDLLPQISNMMNRKVSNNDFLKIVTVWPQAYKVDYNSNGELMVNLPKKDPLAMLTNNSRKLDFVKKLEEWYENVTKSQEIPDDIPVYKIGKRRGSDGQGSINIANTNIKLANTRPIASPAKYISNPKEKFQNLERPHDSQENLLERLRERERRSAALLSQRKNNYEQFLTVKMKQVFEIMYSLRPNEPYTATYLATLTVDSLQNSNNPVGYEEATDILDRLERLLGDILIVHTVDGGLKVYRWELLDRDQFMELLDKYKKHNTTNM